MTRKEPSLKAPEQVTTWHWPGKSNYEQAIGSGVRE